MFEIYMLEAIYMSIINLNESTSHSLSYDLQSLLFSPSLLLFLKNTTQSNINLMTGKFL